MNKFNAKELYVRLTAIQRIDSGPARELIKEWVERHRQVVYKALEDMANAPSRMDFVQSTYCGKYVTAGDGSSFEAYSPTEMAFKVADGTVEYMWLTEEALYVRLAVSDYASTIVERIVPADSEWRGEGVGPFWEAVVDEFVENNIEEFGGELQVMKDRVCLMFCFRKDIPDFITPHPKGQK